MKEIKKHGIAGFSLVEMLLAMTITLMLLAIASSLFARALSVRARESRRTDALTSAQAALNVMSREISNAGYGMNYEVNTAGNTLPSNGLKISDCTNQKIHFRANIVNTDGQTTSPGEDVTYYFDATTNSIVRYDAHGVNATTSSTSVIVNRISEVTFTYFDYTGASSTGTSNTLPSRNTGRVRINITVTLDPVQGQPNGTVSFTSEVTLRNSNYMLNQY